MSALHTRRRTSSLIERLESRTLLSVDLVPTIDDARSVIPEATVSGDGTRITVKFAVANQGDEAVALGQRIDAKLVLHQSGMETVELAAVDNLNISRLRAGAEKAFTVHTKLPAGIPSGTGQIEVVIDSANAVEESNESNNADSAATEVAVTRGFVSLTNTIASSRLPLGVVSGKVAKGSVKVEVRNDGNIAVVPGSRVDVNIVLRPNDGGADIVIGSKLGHSLGKVKLGASKLITVPATVPADLSIGAYTTVATVAPTNFEVDASPVATGLNINATAAPTPFGVLGNVLTITEELVPPHTQTLPFNAGTTTVQTVRFVDNNGRVGDIMFTWNTGLAARATQAIMGIRSLTDGWGLSLKGTGIQKNLAVGTQLIFGSSGPIVITHGFSSSGTKLIRINP